MKQVYVITGPTAVGKTAISTQVAKRINGEIISADSMQIYKYMNIGTAKPDEIQMNGIKHYLIDEINPDEDFSVAKFKELAMKYIEEILKKGKKPIICGGTGLYINSVVQNIEFVKTVSDIDFRKRLEAEAREKGNKFLHEKLRKIDATAAERIHENNLKRVIRALEIYELSNTTITSQNENSKNVPSEYEFKTVCLTMDRKELYRRIELRVDQMFEQGLVEEVNELNKMGINIKNNSMQGIGYKEILEYINNDKTLVEVVELIKKRTRNYAKRQMTWFGKMENVRFIDISSIKNTSDIAEEIIKYFS